MMTRRVEVQRWPAVPTAPKKIDCVAISRSAVGQTMSALFPPSSMIVLPNRPWTVFATFKPIASDPVAEINGIRASSANFCPTLFRSPISKRKIERRDYGDEPKGMPLLHQTMARPFRLNRQTVKHARLADGEIADVDHF